MRHHVPHVPSPEHQLIPKNCVVLFVLEMSPIHSFIHSIIQAIFIIAPLQVHYYSEAIYRHSTDTVSDFHPEARQATASERLAQGPYVAARAGFEPATLRTNGVESTKVPPRPTHSNSNRTQQSSTTQLMSPA